MVRVMRQALSEALDVGETMLQKRLADQTRSQPSRVVDLLERTKFGVELCYDAKIFYSESVFASVIIIS